MRQLRRLAGLAFALALLAAPAAAHRVFFVDPNVAQSGSGFDWSTAFKTIQEAIDASDGDDMVIIAPGVYQGPISVRTRRAALRQDCGADNTTCSGASRCSTG